MLCTGCTDGQLWYQGDREVLRSALARVEVVDGAPHASIVLSNGLFTCDLPKHDDPARAQQALQNLVAAACREGARHVSLQLWRDADKGWEGRYTGIGGGGPVDLSAKRPRVADAIFYNVDEAFLSDSIDLDRGYHVSADTLVLGALDGGTVDIDHHDAREIRGSAYLPELDVHADFRAEVCKKDDVLIQMIAASPAYVCPESQY